MGVGVEQLGQRYAQRPQHAGPMDSSFDEESILIGGDSYDDWLAVGQKYVVNIMT